MTEADRPLVSVITPSLNQGRFIEEAILSVADQDYPRIEHLVIDGGSGDGTLEIVRRHSHLVWRFEPGEGQTDAVNRGIRLAKGEILGWLNADDAYAPDAVGTAVEYLRKRPDVDLVYGDCHVRDERGALLEVRRSRRYAFGRLLTLDQAIPQPTVFFRRRVVDRVGLLDATLELAMDFDFWVRAGRRCGIAHVPAIRSTFRSHAATKSSRRPLDVLPEIIRTLERTFADPALPRELARLRREAFNAAWVAGGIRAYNAGERAVARPLLLRGLAGYPHPFRLRTLKAALLLGDILMGTHLGTRLRDFRHRLSRLGVTPVAPTAAARDPTAPSR